jgi:hypothetical protein
VADPVQHRDLLGQRQDHQPGGQQADPAPACARQMGEFGVGGDDRSILSGVDEFFAAGVAGVPDPANSP